MIKHGSSHAAGAIIATLVGQVLAIPLTQWLRSSVLPVITEYFGSTVFVETVISNPKPVVIAAMAFLWGICFYKAHSK